MSKYIQVCSSCGKKKVYRLQWVNVNNQRDVLDMDSYIDTEWCEECQETCKIVDKDDYKKEED